MKKYLIILLLLLYSFLFVQAQTKIIDMHAHSYTESDFGERESATDYYGHKGAANAAIHRAETFADFKKWNIVKASVSGNPQSVDDWVAKDTNHIVIRGILMYTPTDYGIDTVKFEQMIKDKKIEVRKQTQNRNEQLSYM